MEHFQNQSDGNPIRTGGAAFGMTSGLAGTGLHHGGGHATLRRSNSSSSSSSSEDDGYGGRRKKGLRQKIKEKLPGGHRAEQPGLQHNGPEEGKDLYAGGPVTTPAGGYGAYEHHQKKKGIIGKIKDKLPGNH